jgi:hypothetical protein
MLFTDFTVVNCKNVLPISVLPISGVNYKKNYNGRFYSGKTVKVLS